MAEDPLSLLCIEPRFPGRLGATADWLVRKRGYRCQFFCAAADPPAFWPEAVGHGLDVVQFSVGGVAAQPGVHWSQLLERGLCYAYGCWEVLDKRRPRPVDLVLGRSNGLGSTLFAPVAFPNIPVVNLFDYFYRPHANDLAGETGPDTPAAYFHWRRAANTVELLDLENGVTPWVPTPWQRDLFPAEYHADFVVLHDGVDTRRFAPRPGAPRVVAGRVIAPETRVVSFIARHLDRLRGFDRFIHLANALLEADCRILCIALGGFTVQRGLDTRFVNQDYPAHVLAHTPPHDPERFWLPGAVPPQTVAELLAASDLHVYPSRTYAASRSLLEALACGCVVLATDSDPVREILGHGQAGLLAPPDDPDAWRRQALAVLRDPDAHRPLRAAAVALAREHYAQDVTLRALARLFDGLVAPGG